jgi:uncharacterized protein YbjT (DUF2867 family)
VLVAGAGGYIAGRLVPRLLDAGYRVRCMVRKPEQLRSRTWYAHVECVAGDVTSAGSLHAAMVGVSAAYYLVHSMAAGPGYPQLDIEAARIFSGAAKAAGIGHIVYLGGLADEAARLAPHLRSRIETGRALREAGVPVTELRAAVIVGPGSVSFEMIRFIVERSPLVVGPRWLLNRTQPIAINNVLDYLVAALSTPACRGRIVEIGGTDRMTYEEAMERYARARGLRRRFLLLPIAPVRLIASIIARSTPVAAAYALPLVRGLENDSVVRNGDAQRLFPGIRLLGYDDAVRRALNAQHPDAVQRAWLETSGDMIEMRHEGFLVDHWRITVSVSPEAALAELADGELHTWPFARWQVEVKREDFRRCRAAASFGLAWREIHVTPRANGCAVESTVFLAPRGSLGFLSWSLLRLRHRGQARRLLRAPP